MKLTIIRAWKDENYRQSLSEEERRMIPANPAGELSDVDLEAVYGAGGGGFGPGAPGLGGGGPVGVPVPVGGGVGVVGGGAGVGSSLSTACVQRIHSFSFECDENEFSDNEIDISARLLAVLSPTNQVCINND